MEQIFKNLKENTPIIHCITNYVTATDCANILIAAGASPIMADDPKEAEDITNIAMALDINIGTLNTRTIESMIISGKTAMAKKIPVLLDPVGLGASKLRNQTTMDLTKEIQFSVIRGNASELRFLGSQQTQAQGKTSGVDASAHHLIEEDNLDKNIAYARELSSKTGAVIVITGAIDIVSDPTTTYVIRNGHPMMAKITGSGCMLSALVTAFIGANPGEILKASALGVMLMGISGEMAFKNMREGEGNSTYRNRLIDGVFNMNWDILKEANYEIR